LPKFQLLPVQRIHALDMMIELFKKSDSYKNLNLEDESHQNEELVQILNISQKSDSIAKCTLYY